MNRLALVAAETWIDVTSPYSGEVVGRVPRVGAAETRAALDAAAGAVEEIARVVAHVRRRWPRVHILLRADSGFAREDLMAWCEANGVDFLFGLAKNERLIGEIKTELDGSPSKADVPAGWRAASKASCG